MQLWHFCCNIYYNLLGEGHSAWECNSFNISPSSNDQKLEVLLSSAKDPDFYQRDSGFFCLGEVGPTGQGMLHEVCVPVQSIRAALGNAAICEDNPDNPQVYEAGWPRSNWDHSRALGTPGSSVRAAGPRPGSRPAAAGGGQCSSRIRLQGLGNLLLKHRCAVCPRLLYPSCPDRGEAFPGDAVGLSHAEPAARLIFGGLFWTPTVSL